MLKIKNRLVMGWFLRWSQNRTEKHLLGIALLESKGCPSTASAGAFTLAGTRTGRPTQARRRLAQIAGTVPNGTVLLGALEHHVSMSKMKAKEESDKTLLSNVKKEMAKPRMAKSARGESESSCCANRAGQLAGVLASEEQL